MCQHLFVLTPPYSGSTLLWQILKSSPNVTALPKEGQQYVEKELMPGTECLENPERPIQWEKVKDRWMGGWDLQAPIRLDKSPAAIHHAEALTEWFPDTKFIALIRDPYAFCEGCYRRKPDYSYRDCARFWLTCARSQRKNVRERESVMWFTYEAFTEQTEEILQQILDFLPILESLQTAHTDTFTVNGRARDIANVNPQKLEMLSSEDVREINAVLGDEKSLLRFFGYQLRDPSRHSRLQSYRARFTSHMIRGLRRVSRSEMMPEAGSRAIQSFISVLR